MNKPPDKPTISDYINAELDKLYAQTAQPTIDQIQNLSTSPSGRMQMSLRKLDDEAQRLEDNKENISPDNAQLEQTINDYQATMTTSSDLIKSNDNTVQNSVIALAISAVTAKVFLYAAGKLMDAGKPPVGDYSMKFYTNAINQAGLSWNVITSADQVTNYVDSAAWTTKMEGYGEGYANLTRNTIIDMIQRGAGPKTVASKMREHAENIPKYAADNLMRTLQLTSYRDASLAMETINGDSIEYKVRIAKLDDRTCLACIGLHGTRLEVGERVEDHYSGRAEMPENIITSTSPTALKTLHYNRDIIVIHTASGKLLPVTAYHPVLTDRGWVAAKFVKVGDNVVSNEFCERTADIVNPNKKHVPTKAHNLARSFNMFRLGSMPESAEDFYRKTIDGNIDVVYVNRLLWNRINSSERKRIYKHFFGCGSCVRIDFSRFGGFQKMFSFKRPTSVAINGFLDNAFSFLRAHSNIPQTVCLGHSARAYPVSKKFFSNDLSGNSDILGDSIFSRSVVEHGNNRVGFGSGENDFATDIFGNFFRLNSSTFGFTPKQPIAIEVITESLVRSVRDSGGNINIVSEQIMLDPIVEVGYSSFSGHVYSIQTDERFYYSNGIISHNCSEIYKVAGVDLPDMMQADSQPGKRNFVPFQTGEEWFASLPPERQAKQASFSKSPAKLRAYQRGTKLSDFVGDHDDNVFGTQKVEKSLVGIFGDGANEYYSVKKKTKTVDVFMQKQDLSGFENNIYGSNYETAGVFSQNGELLFSKKGSSNSVKFTIDELNKMDGAILTHNHPNNTPFSRDDIKLFVRNKSKEIRVITDKHIHSMSNDKSINIANKKIDSVYKESLRQAIINDPTASDIDILANTWDIFANKTGLTYKREKR